MTVQPVAVRVGLERCCENPPQLLQGARLGLLMNQASVDTQFRYAHSVISDIFPGQLRALFGPQHGFWIRQQDNMIETPHDHDSEIQAPIYSLYADQRKPTREMLDGIDCLLIDLQDVGTRVYTFIWTLSYCLEACADAGIKALVLDRPNPLGGVAIEGPRLKPPFRSFVGRYSIPMRHGLTIGEMARFLNQAMQIDADLQVVPMEGWQRSMDWRDTGRVWLPPSPNLPRIEGVDLYPGQVLIEGTNLSEGRGTTTPFEWFGAPYINSHHLLEALQSFQLDGVAFRPISFEPTFQKWQDQCCYGLFVHVIDRERFQPYLTTLAILASIKRLWPEEFAWLSPPYEYEDTLIPIDILTGSDDLRLALQKTINSDIVSQLAQLDASTWWDEVHDCLLY
jgi:uncharacterized protein YbbC (DUF1343 family)